MKTKLKKSSAAGAQFERVESGIFRYIPSGVYYERPKINGRRTWRSLETANLKYAREELHRRRSGMVEREAQQAKKPKVTVGEIVRRYVQDGYPDRQKQPRQPLLVIRFGSRFEVWHSIQTFHIFFRHISKKCRSLNQTLLAFQF